MSAGVVVLPQPEPKSRAMPSKPSVPSEVELVIGREADERLEPRVVTVLDADAMDGTAMRGDGFANRLQAGAACPRCANTSATS